MTDPQPSDQVQNQDTCLDKQFVGQGRLIVFNQDNEKPDKLALILQPTADERQTVSPQPIPEKEPERAVQSTEKKQVLEQEPVDEPFSPTRCDSPSRILRKQEDRFLNRNIERGMFADPEDSVHELKLGESNASILSSQRLQLRNSKRKPLKLAPVRSLAQEDKVKVIGQEELNRFSKITAKRQSFLGKLLLTVRDIADNHQFVRQYIPKHKTLCALLKRNKTGTNWLFPQYDLFLNEDMHYLMSSKRKPFFATSTYFLGSSIEPVNSPFDSACVGLVKSNLTGSIFNIMDTEQHSNELLATIEYINQLSCAFMPRSIVVYLLSPYYRYKDLSGLDTESGNARNLKELYDKGDNAENKRIIRIENKQPVLDSSHSTYYLDFHGKALMSSVKNMILVESEDKSKEVMLLAKAGDNSYNFQVNFPLSTRVALGIANSSFDFKWVSQ